MRYYANPVSHEVREAMRQGLLGFIATPAQGNKKEPGVDWCADNGCFSNKWNGDHWWRWLDRQERTMRFATCPDVVGNWNQTLRLFNKWAPRMTAAQIPVAVVAQDGATPQTIPWDDVSCVFIGGTTEWKLSATAESIVAEANRKQIWAHIGRVNSYKRLRWANDIGANSCDGTMLVFHPTICLERLLRWLSDLQQIPSLPLWAGDDTPQP